MIGLLQRVAQANVMVDGTRIAEISSGLVVLVGVQPGDDEAIAARLLDRILGYRVFNDEHGKMNRSLRDVDGGLLLVPQFTLAADTNSGRRPSFSSAAPPAVGHALFDKLVESAQQAYGQVACGRFGADMQVNLTNDGPVTFWLEVG